MAQKGIVLSLRVFRKGIEADKEKIEVVEKRSPPT